MLLHLPRLSQRVERLAWIALTLAVLLLVSGCASIRPLEAPDLTLSDLEVTDMTALETSARLAVRIANTNPEPLNITGGVFNITLGGVKVGQALSNQALEVPALSEAVTQVDLRINNIALLTRLRPILETGTVDYGLKAKVYAEGTFGTRRLKVRKTGSMTIPESWSDSFSQIDSLTEPPNGSSKSQKR